MNFSKIAKELREEAGLSQQKLADKIGLSSSAIARWELGQSEPGCNAILAYAKFFDVSADYLLGLEDDFGARTATNAAPMGDSATTSEELRLLKVFRTLSPDLKNTLWSLLDTWTPTETLLPPKKKQT